MIPKAVSDYWKSDMTILKYFQNDPLYLRDIPGYKASLSDKLFYEKDTVNREAKSKDQGERNNLSKRFYNTAMQWVADDFGSIIRNQDFFQRGIIHNIVDDGVMDWKVGEEADGNK